VTGGESVFADPLGSTEEDKGAAKPFFVLNTLDISAVPKSTSSKNNPEGNWNHCNYLAHREKIANETRADIEELPDLLYDEHDEIENIGKTNTATKSRRKQEGDLG